jgi:predicted DNA-binding protein
MGDSVKFSSKMDSETLEALRAYAREEGRTVSGLLTEAVQDYLATKRVRPAFREAAEDVLSEHDELLARLAK